jgi:hypothetical protein
LVVVVVQQQLDLMEVLEVVLDEETQTKALELKEILEVVLATAITVVKVVEIQSQVLVVVQAQLVKPVIQVMVGRVVQGNYFPTLPPMDHLVTLAVAVAVAVLEVAPVDQVVVELVVLVVVVMVQQLLAVVAVVHIMLTMLAQVAQELLLFMMVQLTHNILPLVLNTP